MISFLEIIIYSLFILSVNSLSEPKKAYRGNLMAIAAMAAAVTIGLWGLETKYLILAFSALGLGAITGIIAARKINMPDLPQMVALLNGFGGNGLRAHWHCRNHKHNSLSVTVNMHYRHRFHDFQRVLRSVSETGRFPAVLRP